VTHPVRFTTAALRSAVCVAVLFAAASGVSAAPIDASDAPPLRIAVSVPPLTWFAVQLAGPGAEVVTALPAGSSPASYDPTPRQAMTLLDADLYVAVGVAMESALLPALRRDDDGPLLCDAGAAVDLLPAPDHHGHDHGHDHGDQGVDPHVWLSPRRAADMAGAVADAVTALRPDQAAAVAERLAAVRAELAALDAYAADRLAGPVRPLLVQHPAYGYLAADYGLEVLTVERAGMAPSPAHLGRVITEAKERGASALVVQPQFADGQVLKAARALGLEIVELDPLAPDYPDAMRRLIDGIARLTGPVAEAGR